MAGKRDTTTTQSVTVKGTEELEKLTAAFEKVAGAANAAGAASDAAVAGLSQKASMVKAMADAMAAATGQTARISATVPVRVGPPPRRGRADRRPEMDVRITGVGTTPAQEAAEAQKALEAKARRKISALGLQAEARRILESGVQLPKGRLGEARRLVEVGAGWLTDEDIRKGKLLKAEFGPQAKEAENAAKQAEQATKQTERDQTRKMSRRAAAWRLQQALGNISQSGVPLTKDDQALVRDLLDKHPSWFTKEDIERGKVVQSRYGQSASEANRAARATERAAETQSRQDARRAESQAATAARQEADRQAKAVRDMPRQAYQEGIVDTRASRAGRRLDDIRGYMNASEYNEVLDRMAEYRGYIDRGEVEPAKKVLQDIEKTIADREQEIKGGQREESVTNKLTQTKARAQSLYGKLEKYSPDDAEKVQKIVSAITETEAEAAEKGAKWAGDREKALNQQLKTVEALTKEQVKQGQEQERQQAKESTRMSRMGMVYAASRFVSSLGSIGGAAVSGGAQGVGGALVGLGGALGSGLQNISASSIINKGLGIGNALGFGLGALTSVAGSVFSALHNRGKAVIARADSARTGLAPIIGSMVAATGASPTDILTQTGGQAFLGELGGSSAVSALQALGGNVDRKTSAADVERIAAIAADTGESYASVARRIALARDFDAGKPGDARLYELRDAVLTAASEPDWTPRALREATKADAARRAITSRAMMYGMEGQVTAQDLRTAAGSTARRSSMEFAQAALPPDSPFGKHLPPALRGAVGAAAYANQRGLDVGAVAALAAAGGDFNFKGLASLAMLPSAMGFAGGARNSFIQSMTGALQSAGMQGISGDIAPTMRMGLAAVNQGGNAQEVLAYLQRAIGGMGSRAADTTGGARGFVEDMAYVEAMSRGGGDIFKAQDIMRSMTPEERIAIARRHSEFLTEADLRSTMSGESARALLAGQADPSGVPDPTETPAARSSMGFAIEAVQRAVQNTQQGLQDIVAETTVTDEQRIERAANTLDRAAASFSHSVNSFGAAVINLFG